MNLTLFKLPFDNQIVIIYIVLLLFFVVILILRKIILKPEYPYYENPNFMTNNEKAFFKVLNLIVGNKFYILCQVNLSSLIGINKKGKERQGYFNKISRKSVDFVLLNKETLNPILVIELDDSTHLLPARITRDEFVDEVMRTAQIPLLHFKNRTNYIPEELKKQIYKKINSN